MVSRLKLEGRGLVAGVDEAGRGPIAGPVVASAVILPDGVKIEGLNDSKKVTPSNRERLFSTISKEAVCLGIGIVDTQTIDRINILQASLLAMKKAIENMSVLPSLIIVDGIFTVPGVKVPQKAIPKADSTYKVVSAASILAKVTRDKIMEDYELVYPGYGFAKHKGYPTKEHVNALKKKGVCPIHRLSFRPVKTATKFLELF